MLRICLYSVVVLILSVGCKSQFEKVRVSNDPELMYATADTLAMQGDYSKAILLYEMIIPAYRGKVEAEKINYKFADTHFKNRNYILSSHYFKTFADTYTTSPLREEALYLSALSEYYQAPKFKLDQTNSLAAIDAFQLFVNTFPDSERVSEVNGYVDGLRKKLEQKAFEAGRLYYNLRNYNSAIQTLGNMLKEYPGSDYTEEALFLMVKAKFEWADRSIYARQVERFTATMEQCKLFDKKYPNSEYSEEIDNYVNKCQTALNRFENG